MHAASMLTTETTCKWLWNEIAFFLCTCERDDSADGRDRRWGANYSMRGYICFKNKEGSRSDDSGYLKMRYQDKHFSMIFRSVFNQKKSSCNDNQCMKQISVQMVISEAKKILVKWN